MLSNENRNFTRPYQFPLSPSEPLSTDFYGQSALPKPVFDLPLKTKADQSKNGNNHQSGKLAVASMVIELLQTGQYEQAANLLQQVQQAKAASIDTTELNFLMIAQQLCHACIQCRDEVAWHRQAVETANLREQELSQQLYSLLARSDERSDVPVTTSLVTAAIALPAKEKRAGKPLAALVVKTLGRFQVYQQDGSISDWPSLKARSIFKYLVGQQGVPATRDILMDIFWPDADAESARHNLHQAIHSLRKTLRKLDAKAQVILFENNGYLLNPELNIHLDFVEFEQHVQAGRRLELAGQMAEAVQEYRMAVDLYRGDFLEEDLYEDWPGAQREYFRQLYLDLVDQLSEYFFQQHNYPETIALCQKMLSLDNCYEEAHRRLMRCYLAQGQRRLTIRQYQLCVQALSKELDVTPSPETQHLYEEVVKNTSSEG
jgi:DNA-binding SARP family transcriptional activator